MKIVMISPLVMTLPLFLAYGPVAAAAPSPSPAPLRHIVFSVKLEVTRVGVPISLKDRGGSTPTMQSALVTKGRITCDLIAFDKAGDLVIDINEDATDRVTPVRRVLVHNDGSLSYAVSSKPLDEEEEALLRLLALGTIGAATREAGSSWAVQNTAGTDATTTNYRVTAVRAPDEIVVAIDQDENDSGAEPFSAKTHGTVVYDPTKIVPRSVNLNAGVALKKVGDEQTLNYEIELGLLEDSLSKK